MKSPPSYECLSEHADDEKLLPHDNCIAEPTVRDKALNWRCVFAGIFIGILFSLLAFSTVAFVQPKNKCTQKMSTWSPALEIFNDDDFEIQRFNGTLRVPHEFSALPSDEIDEKWEKISFAKGGLMRLSKGDVHRINASEYAAEYTEEMGGGYMGAFEVFHGLHCLNMLRQASYMDHYLPKKKEWRDDPETLRFHLDHCIDMLRQKLMCEPDLGMVTYVWTKGFKQVFPDFNVIHKCRPYSKVLDWAEEHSVHSLNVSGFVRAPGALEQEGRP